MFNSEEKMAQLENIYFKPENNILPIVLDSFFENKKESCNRLNWQQGHMKKCQF